MNVLIFTQSYYVRKTYVNALIPMGISVTHSESSTGILEKIQVKVADLVILDAIQENYDDMFPIVSDIKNNENEDIRKTGVIMLISGITKDYLVKALHLGVIGFIKNNASEDTISKYVIEIYGKIKGAPPERKFVRVSLNTEKEAERVGVKFRSPDNQQLLLGVARDISAGGIAVELVGTYNHDALLSGTEVKNMQFILNGKDVIADAMIMAYQKGFIAFRFTSLSQQDKEIISQFIFEKIS